MKSRYDYMQDGIVLDIDKQSFPDPLSINYSVGILEKIPTEHYITSADMAKPWKYYYSRYNEAEGDDIFWNINGLPYIGMLEPGSRVYEPSISDMEGFILNKPKYIDPD